MSVGDPRASFGPKAPHLENFSEDLSPQSFVSFLLELKTRHPTGNQSPRTQIFPFFALLRLCLSGCPCRIWSVPPLVCGARRRTLGHPKTDSGPVYTVGPTGTGSPVRTSPGVPRRRGIGPDPKPGSAPYTFQGTCEPLRTHSGKKNKTHTLRRPSGLVPPRPYTPLPLTR